VTLNIIVCGYETLTIDEDAAHTFNWDFVDNPDPRTESLTPFFISNDTDCPSVSHTVYTSASKDEPTEAEAAKFQIATEGENDVEVVQLLGNELGQFTYFIEGETVTGETAMKEFLLDVVCGSESQTVSLVDSEAFEVSLDKNQDVASLISAADVAGFFEVAASDRCPVESYVLLDSNGDEIESGDSLYS